MGGNLFCTKTENSARKYVEKDTNTYTVIHSTTCLA